MKKAVLAICLCLASLMSYVYASSVFQTKFPKPAHGYSETHATYDDDPPTNPKVISFGSVSIKARPIKLNIIECNSGNDGLEFVGVVRCENNQRATVACMAVDVFRSLRGSNQLMASRCEFFQLSGEEVLFRLPIRLPEYQELMDVSVCLVLMDEEGNQLGSEHVIAAGEIQPGGLDG